MATQIKITQLTDIGSANLAVTTLLPVVNMAGLSTTQKTTLGNLANVILSQAGGNYAPVAVANLSYSVTNAAQPNITSVGTLTNVVVSGNASINGNITSNGTAYVGNLSTTGLASITTLNVGGTANLGNAGNVKITGGTSGYVLQTDGTGNLSWTAQTGGGGNGVPGGSNTQVQFNDAGSFGGNSGFTFDKTTGIFTSPFVAGNGNGLSNIQGANVSGTVGNANLSQFIDVSSVNNNFSYHLVLSAGDGDKSIHIDADDNLQYNPADGTLTAVRVDATYVLADLQFSDGYPAANVTGLGNIATANFDGNASNVLHGDGSWSADTTTYSNSNVASFLAVFGSNTITTTGNVSVGNITATSISPVGNFDFTVVTESANIDQTWTFGANGRMVFPSGLLIEGVTSPQPATILLDGNGIGIATSFGNAIQVEPSNITIVANSHSWHFTGDGNLTLPNIASPSINYANGSSAFGNMVQWTTAPIANTSAGAAGQAAYDSGGNLYVCVSANTWAKFTGTTSW